MKKWFKTWLAASLVVASPLVFAAQETREVPEFKAIRSEGAYKLVVNVGKPQSVVLSADEDVLARLATKVVGEELVISMPEVKNYKYSDKVTITIDVPTLTKFQMEGAGTSTLNNLSGERFQMNSQGVGRVAANGKVQNLVMRMEGVGSVNTRDVDAQNVDVKLEGVGSAKVRASESLNARVDGIGSLTYYGNPPKVTKRVDGIGSVRAGD